MLNNLLATACMVPLAGLPMWSERYGLILDGGLSDLQILRGWVDGSFNAVHDCASDAITACPFYFSRADIKPDKYVPFWWAFLPPEAERVREIYRMGQRNATDWIIATKGGTLPRSVPPPPGGRRPTWDVQSARHTAEEYVAAARAAARHAADAASGAAHKMEGLATDAALRVEGLATDAAHAVSGAAHAAEEFALHAAAVASDAARHAAEYAEKASLELKRRRGLARRALRALFVWITLQLVTLELFAQAVLSPLAAIRSGSTVSAAVGRFRSFAAPLPVRRRPRLSPAPLPSSSGPHPARAPPLTPPSPPALGVAPHRSSRRTPT